MAGDQLPLPPPLITGRDEIDRPLAAFFARVREKLLAPLLAARWLEVAAEQSFTAASDPRRFAVRPPYVRDVALKAGVANVIPHRLGRRLEAWTLADLRGQATVWRDPAALSTGETDAQVIVLRCSADVTVRVWVA